MYDLWEIDDYNCIIDGATKSLLFTVNTPNNDDLLPIMRKIAAAPALYTALKNRYQALPRSSRPIWWEDDIAWEAYVEADELALEAIAKAEGGDLGDKEITKDDWGLLRAYQAANQVQPRHVYAWKILAEETTRLFEALPKDLRVRFLPGQPYATAADMHSVIRTRHLVISTDHNFHPVWTCEENLRFRAVHDWYGHILTGYDFTLEGERRAYEATAELHTPSAKHALFTEVYIQALYAIVLGHFPEQKVVLV